MKPKILWTLLLLLIGSLLYLANPPEPKPPHGVAVPASSPVTAPAPQTVASPLAENAKEATLHVATDGRDENPGSYEQPLATVAAALAKVGDQPVTIRLLGGIYREQVTIPAPENPKQPTPHITIEAAPGESVIFEGGEAITQWEPHPSHPGIFRVAHAIGQKVRDNETAYYDVWENETRIRYRKQNDLPGLTPFPGSICLEGEDTLLIHTRDGQPPASLQLWRSRHAYAMKISRKAVRLRNLSFRNYTGGGQACGLMIHATVEIDQCHFSNCVMAIANFSHDVRITRCDIKEVGLGILNKGNQNVVEDCIIQSAAGAFRFSELNQHFRDGVRFYHPSEGGTVRNTVTVGFWAGLYIKTIPATSKSLPFIIENNTFLDGVAAGSGSGPAPFTGTSAQPRSYYSHNVIGPSEHTSNTMIVLPGIGATLKNNYFFSLPDRQQTINPDDPDNASGPSPFRNPIEGDLTLVDLPSATSPIGARHTKIEWSQAIRQNLAAITAPPPAPELAFITPPTVTSSSRGALITVRLSKPAPVVLKYRTQNDRDWTILPGRVNDPSVPDIVNTAAPIAPAPPSAETSYLFNLTGRGLPANQSYQGYLEISASNSKAIRSDTFEFQTRGGPKTLHVQANASPQQADGSAARPFREIQPALDRALPGDTLLLAPGVYSKPGFITHGGTAGQPITLRGAGKHKTILDGGKEAPILLELEDAPYLTITDVTVRWFGNQGISARQSPHLEIHRSHFQNVVIGESGQNGTGIYLANSPGATISHSTFAAMEYGILTSESPGITLTHNTGFRNLYTAARLVNSSRGSTLMYNAWTFTGNDSFAVWEKYFKNWESVTSDYNNYGARLRKRANEPRPENDFMPQPRYGHISGKAMIRGDIATRPGVVNRFFTLKDWRKFSGQDQHSIFADPLYVDPMKADFRVLPGSPHLLPDGRQIGAEGVASPVPPSAALQRSENLR